MPKDVTLSTGQVAVIRSKDELTEGQSRRIEIARSRGGAVLQKYQKRVYLDESGEDTFDVTGAKTDRLAVPTVAMDDISDEEWARINGFTDVLIAELTISLAGEAVADPTTLAKPVYDALSDAVGTEYAGIAVATDSVDDKIDPLAVAAESTDSSPGNLT
jgi:hypothetical protein